MTDDKERRAYDLLQWVPYSLPAKFDPVLAIQGDYTQSQKHRSGKALDDWDKSNPFDSSSELEAFRTLHDLGHFSNDVYFSPARAKNGFYSAKLKQLAVSGSTNEPEKPSRRSRYQRNRSRLASFDA